MRARGAAMVGVGPVLMEANYVSDSALFLGARPCSDVPAVASNEQKVLARAHMRTRHCALSLSLMGGGASRALAMRSRGAALVGVGLVLMEVNYSSEATLSLGARPYSDVPAAASNEQPAFACAHTPPHHLTHSLGRRRTTRACSACTLLCAGCKWFVPYGSPLCQRHPLPRRTAVLRRASCGLQQAAFLRICSTARFSLGRRRTTRDCEAFARLRAGWGRSMPYERRLRQRDGPLPRCTAVIRRASRGPQRVAGVRVCAHANVPPHASLSGGGAPRALAKHAHCSALVGVGPYHMKGDCASETALSLGARPCSDVPAAASIELPAFACAHTLTRHRTLSFGRRRTTHACGACVPRRAGWSRPLSHGRRLRQRHGPLPRCTAVL